MANTSRSPASVSHSSAASTPRDDSMEILVKQRLNRPVAPHLSIYKPQVTWTLSIMTRITGSILSGGLYIFGALYVVSPLIGLQMTSAAMAAGFAKWSIFSQIAAKATLGSSFMYHFFNGLRHLVWDTGSTISNKQVIATGWTVVALTAVSTLGLIAFF